MSSGLPRLTLALVVCLAFSASDTTRYVDLKCTNSVSPYTNWDTAAVTIQDAIDAADPGDLIWVTNGVYATGGRVVSPYALANRVVVDKAVTVQSVNGPEVTVIQGYQVPDRTNGDGAIRCVYLTAEAALIGFTLTNGGTLSWGDLLGEESGGGVWCQNVSAVVSNCVLTGNSAFYAGGGAYRSALDNCLLIYNSVASYGSPANFTFGGGAYASAMKNCLLFGNSASSQGAQVCEGGGVYASTLNNCTILGNLAGSTGGGAIGGVLNNCIVYYNFAVNGSNYSGATLNNCCTMPLPSGGAGNMAADPRLASISHLSADSPCRGAGSADFAAGLDIDGESWGNPPSIGCDEYIAGAITGAVSVAIQTTYSNAPTGFPLQFAAQISGRVSASRWEFGGGTIVSNQPLASHAWTNSGDYPVILRAYNEVNPGGLSATVTVQVVEKLVHYVDVAGTNPVAPYLSWATAATNIQDAIDAVYAAPKAVVLVSDGVYSTGGRELPPYNPNVSPLPLTNRVAVTKPVTVQSAHGPEVTVIEGYQVPGDKMGMGDAAIRCVYLANGAALIGFTLTKGATHWGAGDGGGVWCVSTNAFVSDCILTGNAAYRWGGGACSGTLSNCIVSSNYISSSGSEPRGAGVFESTVFNSTLTGNSYYAAGATGPGLCRLYNCILSNNDIGACWSTLSNCTLTGNSGFQGGGAYYCTLQACSLIGNSAVAYGQGGGAYYSTLNNCTLISNSVGDFGRGGGAYSGTLSNCTLIGNSSKYYGGGASDSTLQNCVVSSNSAGQYGGGVFGGKPINNCVLVGNFAGISGGAAAVLGALNNCTLYGNRAGSSGGGTFWNTNNNCVVYYNDAPSDPNYSGGTLNYSCTVPLPLSGIGNFTNEPLFVDNVGGDLHLQSNSPCINAGTNSYAPAGPDLEGNPRIVAGTVDMGAYEQQAPALLPFFSWLEGYGLPTYAYGDFDNDGMSDLREWVCATDPTNATSLLRLLTPGTNESGLTLTWESVTNRSYFLERGTNMSDQPPFLLLATNLAGQLGTTSFTDTNVVGSRLFYYRVGVQ